MTKSSGFWLQKLSACKLSKTLSEKKNPTVWSTLNDWNAFNCFWLKFLKLGDNVVVDVFVTGLSGAGVWRSADASLGEIISDFCLPCNTLCIFCRYPKSVFNTNTNFHKMDNHSVFKDYGNGITFHIWILIKLLSATQSNVNNECICICDNIVWQIFLKSQKVSEWTKWFCDWIVHLKTMVTVTSIKLLSQTQSSINNDSIGI